MRYYSEELRTFPEVGWSHWNVVAGGDQGTMLLHVMSSVCPVHLQHVWHSNFIVPLHLTPHPEQGHQLPGCPLLPNQTQTDTELRTKMKSDIYVFLLNICCICILILSHLSSVSTFCLFFLIKASDLAWPWLCISCLPSSDQCGPLEVPDSPEAFFYVNMS